MNLILIILFLTSYISVVASQTGDCLKPCGGKGGFCSFCKDERVCCRQGWDDPRECRGAYIPCVGSHCCSDRKAGPKSNCWNACEEKGGWCPGFCGAGRACCRKGWNDPPECRGAAIPVNNYHACSDVKNRQDPTCFKSPPLHKHCNGRPHPSGFRTFDGSCNHLIQSFTGAANTPLERMLFPDYVGNGIPRGGPGYLTNLPPANQVAQAVFKTQTKTTGSSTPLAVLFMTFGQFLDHDFALLDHQTCNVKDCSKKGAFNYPCFPIKFATGNVCTPLDRSRHTCRNKRYRDQVSTLTHFIDGSNIYGSSKKENDELRTRDGTGKMKILRDGLLPIRKPSKKCVIKGGCSLAGEGRADENVALNTMHTIWVREHNRIATELKRRHPSWEENRIFFTARKINIGQYQHIVYNEFLPHIVSLRPYRGYRFLSRPVLLNSFATAAYRFGHSLVPNSFEVLDKHFNRQREALPLRNAFRNRDFISKNGIEGIMFGLLGNQSNKVDTTFAHSLARKLFVKPGDNDHVDLTAINIQRGRDHGIPTYGHWRARCYLPRVRNWKQLAKFMPLRNVRKFQKIYKHPNDIDLFAAGMAEHHIVRRVRGRRVRLQVGPTFECIFREQFTRLRDGDRFFYRARGVFTFIQQRQLRRVSMARILCNNLKGIVSIQRGAFFAGNANKVSRINCNRIPKMNLRFW